MRRANAMENATNRHLWSVVSHRVMPSIASVQRTLRRFRVQYGNYHSRRNKSEAKRCAEIYLVSIDTFGIAHSDTYMETQFEIETMKAVPTPRFEVGAIALAPQLL